MLKKKYVIVGFLTFCLTIAIFIGATTSQKPFDPWFDYLDDGKTNYEDLFYLADRYGASGTAINKTELLRCLTRGNISVPAAALVPMNRTWKAYGYHYIESYEDANFLTCVGPVHLPDGATVTNFTTYWYDAGNDYVRCYLTSYNLTYHYRDLASMTSQGTTGDGSNYDASINNAIVDNGRYAYMLEITIPPSATQDYKFYYAVIEWEYPTLP